MVTVAEASTLVLANARSPKVSQVSVDASVGRVLAETVFADRDLPPIDRVTMDGIALLYSEWATGRKNFDIEGIQAAGVPPLTLTHPQRCIEVMTGAGLPAGTDTVVPYEEVRIEGRNADVLADRLALGQNLHRRGSDAQHGAVLLPSGTLISPAEVALLATVGKSVVRVYDYPSTAVVSSGDELVAVNEVPAPHQVRRSNTYAILSAMRQMGWSATAFHLPDDKEVITAQLKHILAGYDTVILSGGVSKGKFDFIPEALERNGILKQFHRVNQRPGKPFWFGTSTDGTKTVFALPGNPVSTYLCFYRYVRPWVMKCQGVHDAPRFAVLAEDFSTPLGTTYFLQVGIRNERGVLMAYPDAGGGSGDLANLKDVSGFLEISETQGDARKGQVFPYYPFRY